MKAAPDSKIEHIDALLERISGLREEISTLRKRVDALEAGRSLVEISAREEEGRAMPISAPRRESAWSESGGETILHRLAAACFILVAALVLRTITDNNLINQKAGALAGIIYASGLISAGWFLYPRKSRVAGIFPLCGSFLLFAIVLETHGRYNSLSTSQAYLILVAAEVLLATMGLSLASNFILYLGVIGSVVVGFIINFPDISFPYLGIILWLAYIVAFLAERWNVSASLRWPVAIMTILFWFLWSYKLSIPLDRGHVPSAPLALSWFYPFLGFSALSTFLLAWVRIRAKNTPLGFYHGLMPTLHALAFYLAARIVFVSWPGEIYWLGMAFSIYGGIHFFVAASIGCLRKEGAPGCNTMSVAGALLLAMGMNDAIGHVISLPILSLAALLLSIMAHQWQSGGVRLTSYLLQGYVCARFLLLLPHQFTDPFPITTAAASLAILAPLQYYWCRNVEPARADSAYFSWLDRRDMGAACLLFAGLVGFFGLMRLGLRYGITVMSLDQDAFQCGQSILVNLGAALLLAAGVRLRFRELLVVALAVGVLGAARVLLFDLLGSRGIPLVMSVFVFGLTAIVGSVSLKRWRQIQATALSVRTN